VRGTQTLVDQMGWVFRRPSIIAVEVGWRWLFGVPFLLLCWSRLQHIFAALPPESTGLANIDSQNPWIAATQLSAALSHYGPSVAAELRWLGPLAAVVWIVVSSVGRNIVLKRIEPRVSFRPAAMLLLQAVWLAAFAGTFWCWFRSVEWAAATHIPTGTEPDLVGYSMWIIFLSLGFFTLWALINWAISVAPILMLLENSSPTTALFRSFRLGGTLTGELIEISLVMGIVSLALVVLAMVLSAAPLPFSDELGSDALHVVWCAAAIFYLVAHDYFQVVRIKSYIEFWRAYREMES
jgi:hypothetical protein